MPNYHIHVAAHAANRELAAAAEREAVVKFVRAAARYDQSAADVLEVLALCIENGDHLR